MPEECKEALMEHGGFKLTERGLVPMKDKGELKTFFLEPDESHDLVNKAALEKLDRDFSLTKTFRRLHQRDAGPSTWCRAWTRMLSGDAPQMVSKVTLSQRSLFHLQ